MGHVYPLGVSDTPPPILTLPIRGTVFSSHTEETCPMLQAQGTADSSSPAPQPTLSQSSTQALGQRQET